MKFIFLLVVVTLIVTIEAAPQAATTTTTTTVKPGVHHGQQRKPSKCSSEKLLGLKKLKHFLCNYKPTEFLKRSSLLKSGLFY